MRARRFAHRNRCRRLRSLITRGAGIALLAVGAALAFPGIASAGQQTPVTIYNNLDTAVRFHYESNHCWNVDNWDGDPEVDSGQSLTIDSGVQNDSFPCEADSNYTLTFEPEIESGSQWIDPYDASFSNPYNTSSSWELHIAVSGGSSEPQSFDLLDTPGDEAWIPLTAINSITPDGTGNTGLGMICVHYTTGTSGNPGTPLKMYLENEQTCEDASSSSSSASTGSGAPFVPARAPAAPARKGASGGSVGIYALTEMLSGGCSLLFPDNSDCSNIENDDNWSFPTGDDAIPADVENLDSEETITPTLETQYVASQEQDNTGDTHGTMSFAQNYTSGTQQASATTQGYSLSNSTNLNFGSVFTIAQGGDTFIWTGDWSSTDTTTTSDTNSSTYTTTVDTLPNGTTTAILWQGYGSATFNYAADLTFGAQNGTAYPFGTPDTAALGTSPAQTHPCIGYLVGDESVIDSGMYLADVASSKDYYAGDPNVTNAAEQSFLSGMDSWGSSADECPGFPDGFSSGASFDGSGSLTTNTVEAQTSDGGDWASSVANTLELCTYFESDSSSDYSPSEDQPCTSDSSSSAGSANRGDSAPVPGTTIDAADFPHRRSFKGTSFSNLMRGDDTPDFDVMHARRGVFDVMRGGPYRELLDGGKGRDAIRGLARADVLKGGPGFDTVLGGKGADTLSDPRGIGGMEGNAGADELTAGPAARAGLHGGNGRDLLIAKGGESALYGGPGDDHYRLAKAGTHAAVVEFPGEGFDSVSTNRSLSVGPYIQMVRGRGDRNLALSSGAGKQRLFGSTGDDRLAGGDDSDVLAGGPGDDRLLLDPYGLDVARGNQGADRFVPQGDPVRFAGDGGDRCQPNSMRQLIAFKQSQGDRIVLHNSVFGGLPSHRRDLHVINSAHPKPHQSGATLLFDTNGGCLRFDRDGIGPYATKPIAALPGVSSVRKRAFAIRST